MDTTIEKGKELMQKGEFQKAQGFFTALLEYPEKNLAARLWLARLNFMEGKPDSALHHIQAAESANPRNSETKALKGLYYVQAEKYQEALKILESVAAEDPDLAFNYTNLSTAYREVDRIPEAVSAGRKAIELNPDDPAAHFALSQALAIDGQIVGAIGEALETLKRNPMHLMAYLFLGSLYRQAHQIEPLIKLYEECLRHVPDADPIREELVELLFDQENFSSAFDHARVLVNQRGLPKDFFLVGQCAEKLNQDEIAERAFRRTAELDRSNWRPYFLLGELYSKNGLGDEAATAYSEALKRDPENAELMNTLGMVLVRIGRHSEGKPLLQTAIKLIPDRFEPVLNMAIAHAADCKWKEAEKYAHLVLAGTPPESGLHSEAKRLLAAIENKNDTGA